MECKSALIGLTMLTLTAVLLSCKSDAPLAQGAAGSPSDLTFRFSLATSGAVGAVVRGAQLLDSTTGADVTPGAESTQGAGPVSVALGEPLEAVWAKGVQPSAFESALYSVAKDALGNLYAVGYLHDSGRYGLGDGVSVQGREGQTSPLVVKYDASGKTLWARSAVAGTTTAALFSVAVDAEGNVYAAGMMEWGLIGFGGNVRVVAKKVDTQLMLNEYLLLVKYDSAGTIKWARTLARSDGSQLHSVAVDKTGNIYAAGYYVSESETPIQWSHKAPGYKELAKVGGGSHAVVARLDQAGRVVWAAQVEGKHVSSEFYSVAVDDAGNVYAAGYANGEEAPYSFGNGVIVKAPASAILVKYDSSGKAQWARSEVAAKNSASFRSVALSSNGDVFVAGENYGKEEYDFGNGVTVQGSSEKGNPLVVKYDSTGKPQWARSLVSGSGGFEYHALGVDEQNAYVVGHMRIESTSQTISFGGNQSVVAPRGSYPEFLAAYDHSGTFQWAMMPPVKAPAESHIRSICAADQGNLVLAGTIRGNGKLDMGNGISVDGTREYSLFMAEYRTAVVASPAK